MLRIDIYIDGERASGKTRAIEAIAEALTSGLSDKPFKVRWIHKVNGETTESGDFDSSGFSNHKQWEH